MSSQGICYELSRAREWFNRPWLAAIILAAISFWIGYWVSDRRLNVKVSESAQGQVKDFVMFCDRLGCLDRDKLDEALIEARAAMVGN